MKIRKLSNFSFGALALLMFFTAEGHAQTSPTYALSVSTNTNRSNAIALQGASLSGSVFVFTSYASNLQNYNPTGIKTVCYWLDNLSMTGTATHCESLTPYDFAGTASGGTALPWAVTSVSNGTHTITQSVTLSSGGSEIDSVTFSVGSSAVAPSITTQPASQSVAIGQTASFSVAATGTAPISYQWKKNGTSISGATSRSYATPATTSSDSGTQFTVAVSNSAGSVASNAATLTVSSSSGSLPASGSVITLQNANSKLCIDTGGSTNFTYLIQSACSTSKTQQFRLVSAPTSGWYYLSSTASNLCWDIWNGSSSAGALVQQYTCTAVAPEYYQLKAVSGGYEILSQNLANGCVDVVGGSATAGANLEQNACTRAANQVFAASVVNAAGGSSQPQISVTPAIVNFGNVAVNTTNTQTVKLTNSGTANLTISQAAISGSGFSESGLTLPLTLSPGQSANCNVAFAPASVGSVSGTLSVASNASSSPLAISLIGSGATTTSLLGVSPTSLGFGTVSMGGNSLLGVTLTNNGNANVTISSVTASGTGFSASGVSAGATLTPNQSVTVNVAFAPVAAGSLAGSVTVVSNATNSPATIPLSGTGAALSTINVTAFGATGNGSTDDTVAINNAIAALQPGYELFFPCGTYQISAGLAAITKNNVVIAGQIGCGAVTIRSSGSGSTILQVGSSQSLSSPTPITATTTDLDKTFQANFSAIGASVGDYVYLEEAVSTSDATHSNCGGSGCRGEVLKVTGLSGSTATVETAVHHAYDPSCCVPWVQKLLSPVSGVSVHDLVLDGSGAANYALAVLDAVNLTVSNLTAQNVAWSAIASINGYNNSYANVTITHAGTNNGGSIGGSAVSLQQQGNLNVNGVSIGNMNVGAFGFIPFREANGTFSNISVDATGTGSGRPFKTNSSAHNTFNNISVNRSEAAYYQGITLEYFSHHNVWNACKVTNNVGSPNNSGIALYGDVSNGNNQGSNHYNTFNNCTVTGNSGYAIWVSDNNNNIEINGGTYTGVAGQYVIAFDDSSPCCTNNAYVHNATIDGPGSIGVFIENSSKNACINNNTFGSGLSSGIYVTDPSDIGAGNTMNGMSSNLNTGTCGPPLP